MEVLSTSVESVPKAKIVQSRSLAVAAQCALVPFRQGHALAVAESLNPGTELPGASLPDAGGGLFAGPRANKFIARCVADASWKPSREAAPDEGHRAPFA